MYVVTNSQEKWNAKDDQANPGGPSVEAVRQAPCPGDYDLKAQQQLLKALKNKVAK